jgi:predicted acetyltransferase
MFEYHPFADADEETFRNVLFHTLNVPLDYWTKFAERMGRENFRVLRQAGRLIGGLGVYPMGLWFGGRVVPAGGIALVGVAPEHRRQGAAGFLMRENLRELRAGGVPLAALFASSQAVYRSVGYEQAGSRCTYELPLSNIGLEDREVPMHAVALSSSAPFEALYRRRATNSSGHIERSPGLWQRILAGRSDVQYGYLIGAASDPEGYVIYYQEDGGDQPIRIVVRDLCALTPRAGRRLWTFLADHASVCRSVSWPGPAGEPLLALVGECKSTPVRVNRWMLRIVDVEQALRQRGYAADVSAEVHLDVSDDVLPDNAGRYVLNVERGAADVKRGGRGELRCGIRGLAPLYSGLFSPPALQQLGWIDGPREALSSAARAFAGPEPWMPEIF